MSDKKIFTPREAALAVLAKAESLYKSSTLAKKYEGFKAVEESAAKSGASDPAAVAAAVGMKKYGKKNFENHAHEGKKFKKSDENPDAKEDADLGEKVEQDVHEHEQQNPEAEAKEGEGQEPQMKGHMKLAKFMGRMDYKKGQKSKEMDKSEETRKGVLNEDASKMSGKTGTVRGTTESNQNQTGVNQTGNNGRSGGMSDAGNMVRNAQFSTPKGAAEAKQGAKSIHEKTLNQIHQMSKPKLPG